MKGSQGELLDLLQWLYCVLTKINPLDNYDPHGRREMSANGGIVDKIPLPLWLSNKPDGPKYEPHKKWVFHTSPCKTGFLFCRMCRIRGHQPRMCHLRLTPVAVASPRRNTSSPKEQLHCLKPKIPTIKQQGWHRHHVLFHKDPKVEGLRKQEVLNSFRCTKDACLIRCATSQAGCCLQ